MNPDGAEDRPRDVESPSHELQLQVDVLLNGEDTAPTPSEASPQAAEVRPVVLLLDPDADVRAYLRESLLAPGAGLACSVIETDRAGEARRLLASGSVDLLVADLDPRDDALDELMRVAAAGGVRLVLMTGRIGGREARRLAARLGADACLLKPFNARQARETIGGLLRGDASGGEPSVPPGST